MPVRFRMTVATWACARFTPSAGSQVQNLNRTNRSQKSRPPLIRDWSRHFQVQTPYSGHNMSAQRHSNRILGVTFCTCESLAYQEMCCAPRSCFPESRLTRAILPSSSQLIRDRSITSAKFTRSNRECSCLHSWWSPVTKPRMCLMWMLIQLSTE